MRKGEHVVEVFHRKDVPFAVFQPLFFGQRLTLGTVSVPAGIIGIAFIFAAATSFNMTAKIRRAAPFYQTHDLKMSGRKPVTASIIPAV